MQTKNPTMGNTHSSDLGRIVASRRQVVETRHLRPQASSSLPPRAEVMLKTPVRTELEPVADRGSVKGASSILCVGDDETGTYDPEVNGILVIAGDASRFETGTDEAPDTEPTAPHSRPPTIAPPPAETETEQQEEEPLEQQAQQQQEQEQQEAKAKGNDRISESHMVAHDPATGSPGVHIKLEYASITIAGENNAVMGFSSDFLAQAQKHPTGVVFEVKCGSINVAASSRNIKVGHCVN
ncbi:hypothetical protein MAPG_06276 [Magnaporthiopsis poae ATCC 64411]|uniref:Uncharacterized protein n=1 Tax=Magnaporthiopsis poae (strain ATCC 64411 / 73-15) TaxID=644358 RepID=A0A0C4E1L2_MAGP6|nr:hypothetical protein MAPG_06276 [Magnaporthiopsis poae ATCC 64411]